MTFLSLLFCHEHSIVNTLHDIILTCFFQLAVWQQNLSAVHEIWKEYIKYYNLSGITLQNFIQSFTRLGDLKSAYATLQHMVALAFKRSMFINNTDDKKLYSSGLDIPIPSNNELCLNQEIEGDENNVSLLTENCNKFGMQVTRQCTTLEARIREIKIVGIDRVDKLKNLPLREVLKWSFNNVMHACAQAQNYELSEQLMLQVP